MTIQAFEPSKTNSFHPSIMKGAIAMNADDFKPKNAPADAAPASPQEKEADTQYEEAKAWRDRIESQAPADAAALRGLDEEELIYAYRFYLADLRIAEKWRDEMLPKSKDEAARWNVDTIQWLESLSGDDLIWAHKVYQGSKERLALYQKAEEWRDDMLSANLPQNEWLKSLAEMDDEQLAKEYRSFVELWDAPENETEGEAPAGNQRPATEEARPAANDSVTPDYIVCLEDGKKLKTLRRYLKTNYNLSPEEYRQRWGLPADYPMVAPNYSKKRRQLAKESGLGRMTSASKAKLNTSKKDPHITWSDELERLRAQRREAYRRKVKLERKGDMNGAAAAEKEAEDTMAGICDLERRIFVTPAHTPEAIQVQLCEAVREAEEVLNEGAKRDSDEALENLAYRVLINAAKASLTLTPENAKEQE